MEKDTVKEVTIQLLREPYDDDGYVTAKLSDGKEYEEPLEDVKSHLKLLGYVVPDYVWDYLFNFGRVFWMPSTGDIRIC